MLIVIRAKRILNFQLYIFIYKKILQIVYLTPINTCDQSSSIYFTQNTKILHLRANIEVHQERNKSASKKRQVSRSLELKLELVLLLITADVKNILLSKLERTV